MARAIAAYIFPNAMRSASFQGPRRYSQMSSPVTAPERSVKLSLRFC